MARVVHLTDLETPAREGMASLLCAPSLCWCSHPSRCAGSSRLHITGRRARLLESNAPINGGNWPGTTWHQTYRFSLMPH